jgi:hypothetical protein
MSPAEDPIATTTTRLDPDALRQRLRAFQTEFRSGTPGHDADNATANNSNGDLGGDRS